MAKMEPFGGCYCQLDVFDFVRADKLLECLKLRNIARFDVFDLSRA